MIIKTYNEIQKGDVFRTEYGDYGNYVDIVFESNEITETNWLKTVGHYYNSNREFVGYSPIHKNKVEEYYVYEEGEL
jgi:hypothetical protein